jgi:phosphoribosylformimino-5-aminoimidazole carboxamide ribotide isomerase
MRIIPALDIIEGKCVRLRKGDFSSKKIYSENPLEVAKEFEANGIKYIHVVDLDGAKRKMISNLRIVEEISESTGLKIDFGGGIRKTEDIKSVFNAGAIQVTAGSTAVTNKPLFLSWLNEFGPDKIILGADSLDNRISSCAWMETSDTDVVTFIKAYSGLGVKYTICTDIDKDGMLGGPSTSLYREILAAADVRLIASGGISSMKDIYELKEAGCEGAIVGKAIYEGKITLKELGELC